jgi:hypothetical protein
MKKVIIGIALALHLLSVYADESKGRLENSAITWQWNLSSGNVASVVAQLPMVAKINPFLRIHPNSYTLRGENENP